MAFPDVFIVEEINPQYESVEIEEVHSSQTTTITRYDTGDDVLTDVEISETGVPGANVDVTPVQEEPEAVEIAEGAIRRVQIEVIVDGDEDELSYVEIQENEATIPGTTVISVPNEHMENHIVEIQEGTFEAPIVPGGAQFRREVLQGIVNGVNRVFTAEYPIYVFTALVFICGILQREDDHYTVFDENIVFHDPLEIGEVAEIQYQVSA